MKEDERKIIISLTSYPDRIGTIHKVIESLLEQTEKANEIVLWLSKMEFPQQTDDLPEKLKCLVGKCGFRIEWVEGNLKSHKKYFYALQNDDAVVITVDDDMIYASTLIETLMDSYRHHPNAISARNAHMIFGENDVQVPYKHWEYYVSEYIGAERMDLCAVGVNGILYPPGCANEQWFDLEGIKAYAENQDDLWLKYHEIMDKIPIVHAGMGERDVPIEGTQEKSLYLNNLDGSDNDVCWNRLMCLLKKDHGKVYREWAGNLMEKKTFIQRKREFYYAELEKVFADNKVVYIAGAGKYAHILYRFIESCGKVDNLKGFLVTAKTMAEDIIDMKNIDELGLKEKFTVICGVGKKYREEFKKELAKYESCEWIDMDLENIMRLLSLEMELI